MSNESQKEKQNRGVEQEQSQERSAERVEYSGRPHLDELKENPFHYGQARDVIDQLKKTKDFLINRKNCLQKIVELEQEIKLKGQLMSSDGAETLDENFVRLREKIAGIKKELDIVLEVLASDNPAKYASKAKLKKFHEAHFSWGSKMSMLFGGKEKIMERRDRANETVRTDLILKYKDLIGEAEEAIRAEGEKYQYGIKIVDLRE